MDNNRDEQLVYLKDLLFAAFYRWKPILVTALALALALGALQGILGLTSLSSQNNAQANAEQLSQKRVFLEQRLEIAQQRVSNQQDYLENSLLMQLDPGGYYELSVDLYVQTDYQILPGMDYQNIDRTDAVLGAYATIVLSNECAQSLATAANSEPQYIPAILTVEAITASDTLKIKAMAASEETAKAMLTALAQHLQDVYDRVSETVSTHTLSVLEESITFKTSKNLLDSQKAENDRMMDLLSEAESAKEDLNALPAPAGSATTTLPAIAKKAILFGIVGLVLGGFFAVCVIWVMHITTDKVYSGRTLRNRTGIKVIGSVLDNRKNLLLKRWEGRTVTDPQAQLATIAADIRFRAKDAKQLLVAGAAISEELTSALTKEMPGVQFHAGSTLDNASALEMLESCDAVVLVARCGVSCYSSILRETEIISDYKKQLLGCVLIGG